SEDITPALLQRSEGSVRKGLLLSTFGGMEIFEAVDTILADPVLNLPKAHTLATALTGREAEIQYELFRDYLLSKVATEAGRLARSHSWRGADIWSRDWSEATREITEADPYSPDRSQAVSILLQKTHRAFHAGIPQLA